VKTPLGEISDLLVEKHSNKITKLYNQNVLVKDIGERLGISRAAVSRIIYVLKEQGKIKDRGQKGLKNIINAAYDKIKKREGRNPYLLELQRETGVFDNVIKKNLDRPLTSGRTVGPLRGAGAIATKEMYKTKKVDKPRPQKIAGEAVSVNWPSSESKKEYVKQLEEIYKSPKAKRTNQILAKNFGISVNDVERINKVLIKERNLKYPEADTTAVSKQRYGDLKLSQGFPDISAPAKSGYQFHHMLPYAGYAKVKSGDVMLFNKYLNAKIGPENLELNRIAREIVELDLNSDPNALNKLDALNAESEKFYDKAKNRLPKELKGATGYIKYNPIFDENGQVLRLAEERIGIDPKLSLQKFTNNVSKNIKDFSIEEVKKFKTNVINEANSLINKTKLLSKADQIKICNFLSNGGLPGDCARAIKKDPAKAAKIISTVPADTKETAAVKDSAQKLIRLYRGEEPARKTELYKATKGMPGMYEESLKGRFFFDNPADARYYAQRQGTLTGNVKSVDVPEKMVAIGKKMADRRKGPNYSSEVILPKKFVGQEKINIPQTAFARAEAVVDKMKWDNVVGAFTTKDGDIASQADIKTYAAENPMEIKVGEEPLKVATNKSVLKNVGKTLATIGAPLPTALIDGYFINQQVKEGKGTAEIASNPLNWLGLATMSTLSDVSGVSKPGKLNAALRLGLNPGVIRGISRFAGLPGLAISTALTAYDQYQKYKDGEGFIFNLLNQKGTE
jgi:DNA-binding transcriptional ArsR family regulator